MATTLKPYEKAGRVFRLFAWLQIVAFTLMLVAIAIPAVSEGKPLFPGILVGVALFLLPALYMSVGKAILAHENWGRIVGNILGGLMLLGIPIGTIIGAYVLWGLNSDWDGPAASVRPSPRAGPVLKR